MLVLTNVGKQYLNDKWALQNITASFEAGKLIALVGANGAGKSTLINLIVGLLEPSQGSINLRGIDRKSIGWGSQNQMIDWFLSPRDNVALGARFAGYSRQETKELTTRALKIVGLEPIANNNLGTFSGGQLQRIQIARAIVHNPKLLILDEPTVGLDLESAEALLQNLRARTKEGCLVIVSSHDLKLLENISDEIMFIHEGKLLAKEPRETFLAHFAGDDKVHIVFETELAKNWRQSVTGLNIVGNGDNYIEILVKRSSSLSDILSAFDSLGIITDVRREVPGLREAYLKFSSKGTE